MPRQVPEPTKSCTPCLGCPLEYDKTEFNFSGALPRASNVSKPDAIKISEGHFLSENTIAIACDHGGYDLKEQLKTLLENKGMDVLDLGTNSADSVDYPEYGTAMADAIEEGRAGRGILICGSGIGISIAANRNPAVRAAVCHSGLVARLARQHNDANVIALGARLIGVETAIDCVEEFLGTDFEGGRHQRRVEQLG